MAKCLYLIALCLAGTAFGSSVGDSYQKVIDDNGQPRNKLGSGAVMILTYPEFQLKLRNGVVVSVTATPPPSSAPSTPAPPSAPAASKETGDKELEGLSPDARLKKLVARRKAAMDRVYAIVNQPVDSVPLTPDLNAANFPFWFHAGALMPDFDHADLRKERDVSNYAKWEWISSGSCPGLAFRGSDVEFNPQTKYFYRDRSLPKKLLTDAELEEITRLYRIIGKCNAEVGPLPANTDR
jgi:hypothetical protein